ncbi:hypothetical protein DL98DRAFT_583295 [Cadophora sp. DSE1049]|nr:hypothetical protein DL98DRAFT_583295 [Cadophora sp. DSE1049]
MSTDPEGSRVTKMPPNLGVTFIGHSLDNELLTVYVGPNRKEFVLHKKLLCRTSDFFEKAFNSDFQEGKQVRDHAFDEDSPSAFAIFVNWLYRATIEAGSSRSYLYKLVDLYIFLDKICLMSLKDTVMDILQDIALKHKLDDIILFPILKKMARCAAPYKGLTKFCLYAVVDSFVDKHGRENDDRTTVSVRKEDTEMVWKMCRDNLDLFHSYMLRIEFLVAAGLKSESYWNPRARKETSKANRCFFHCHEDTWDCRAKTSVIEEAHFINDEVVEELWVLGAQQE